MPLRCFLFFGALVAIAQAGCVNDDKLPVIPPLPDAAFPTPTSLPPGDASPTPTVTPDATTPPPDAGLEGGVSFNTGLGSGAVVSKSSKYTLITKTGGSPGGHGIAKTPTHTIVSGAAPATSK